MSGYSEEAMIALADLDILTVDSPPPHMLTMSQWCTLKGKSRSVLKEKINARLADGTWHCLSYRIATPAGVRLIPHYGPKAAQAHADS